MFCLFPISRRNPPRFLSHIRIKVKFKLLFSFPIDGSECELCRRIVFLSKEWVESRGCDARTTWLDHGRRRTPHSGDGRSRLEDGGRLLQQCRCRLNGTGSAQNAKVLLVTQFVDAGSWSRLLLERIWRLTNSTGKCKWIGSRHNPHFSWYLEKQSVIIKGKTHFANQNQSLPNSPS